MEDGLHPLVVRLRVVPQRAAGQRVLEALVQHAPDAHAVHRALARRVDEVVLGAELARQEDLAALRGEIS